MESFIKYLYIKSGHIDFNRAIHIVIWIHGNYTKSNVIWYSL